MSIDWNTPKNNLSARFPTADPFGAIELIALLSEYGPIYDAEQALINAAAAAGNAANPPYNPGKIYGYASTSAWQTAALATTSAATDRTATLLRVADLLTRVVNVATTLNAAFPWVPGTPSPIVVNVPGGFPWL